MNRLLVVLRRKRVWIPLAAFVVYTLFGFLVLPGILRDQIVRGVRQNLKRELRLTRVRVNPLLLSLTLEGFELRDPDGTPFVSFDRMFLDVRLTSIVRWALTCRRFELDGPRVHIRLMPDGRLNFDDMIPKESGKPPRLVIGHFQVQRGEVRLSNLTAARPEIATIAPIDLRLENFTTIPMHEGVYRIVATDPGKGSWRWTGELTFEPMHSAGVLEISDSDLRQWWEIAKDRFPFEISNGRFGCRFQYAVDVRGDSLIARVHDTSVSIAGFAMRPKGVEPDLLTLDSLVIGGIEARYPEQTARIQRVLVAGTRIKAWLDPDTTLNWSALFPPPIPQRRGSSASASAAHDLSTRAPRAAAPAAAATPPWSLELGELAIRDLGLDFQDHTTDPIFQVAVAPANLTVRHISSRPGASFDVTSDVTIAEKGKLEIAGTVVAQPPAADLTVRLAALPLPIFQPYLNSTMKVRLASGTLGGEAAVHYRDSAGQPDLHVQGTVESNGFVARDRIDNERFVAWNAVAVKGIDFTPKRLTIASVRLNEPYAKVLLHRDRTTNIQDILGLPPDSAAVAQAPPMKQNRSQAGKKKGRPAPTETSPRPAPMAKAAAPAMPVRVGKIEVVRGSADFADLSLILPFAARIERFAGAVTGLSSDSLSRAAVTMDGDLQPSGSAQVRGQINPLADNVYVDLNVIFHGFNMPTLTPYCGQYMGHEIEKGKMSLDLNYKLQGKHLVGENKIVLDQFELGKKVESPEATRLPVGLAIAILKDGDGQIHLDVPVEGDVDDPSFRLGKVIWNFISSLLKKVALAPFALLGGLFGGGNGDQLSHIDFAVGTSSVPDDQDASLAKLAEALGKRPQLKIEVRGRVDSVLDAVAMRKAKFAAVANERLTGNPKKYGGGLGYSPRLLEDLGIERLGKQGMADFEERFQVRAEDLDPGHPLYKAGSKKVVINQPALDAAIQDTLIALQSVDRGELLTLANERGNAIKQKLVGKGISEERVYVLDPEPGVVEKDRIRIDLNLTD